MNYFCNGSGKGITRCFFYRSLYFVSCSKAVSTKWTLVWWLQHINKEYLLFKTVHAIAGLVFTDLLMVSTRLGKLGNESKSESKCDKIMLYRLAVQVEIKLSFLCWIDWLLIRDIKSFQGKKMLMINKNEIMFLKG